MGKRDQKKSWSKSLRIIYSLAAIALAGILIFLVREYRAAQSAAEIREAAAAVKAGNLKALSSRDGEILTALVEAAGEGPRDQQPAQIQEALRELAEAVLGKARLLYNKPDLTPTYRDRLQDLLIISGTRLAPEDTAWEKVFQPHLNSRVVFLTDWLRAPRWDKEQQLQRMNQAFKAASEMGDGPFVRYLHEERIQLWSVSIASHEDAAGRIIEVRKLILSTRGERDTQLLQKSLIFLGEQIVQSMMLKKDEAGIINQALIDLNPSFNGLMESGLRFEVVLSSVASCGSGDECKRFMDRLQTAFDDLRTLANERRVGIESALKDLFENLPEDKKPEVWEAMFKELESSYLFTVEPGAWPEGLTPLPVRARRALYNRPREAAVLLEKFLHRLASRPVYETEAHYLLRATERKWAEHRLVENCHESLRLLRTGGPPLVRRFQIITDRLLQNQAVPDFDGAVVPGSNESLSDEANRIRGRLASLRQSGWPYRPAPPALVADLKATLRARCRTLADARLKECQ